MSFVICEVQPRADQWEAHRGNATMLRPKLEEVAGVVGNVRYKSVTREGWNLSLSNWRDKEWVVRWRTVMRPHEVQDRDRAEKWLNDHVRIGQLTTDTDVPAGYSLEEPRLGETEVGEGTTLILINSARPAKWVETSKSPECVEWRALDPYAPGMVSWDVRDAELTPGDLIWMMVFKDRASADRVSGLAMLQANARRRQVRRDARRDAVPLRLTRATSASLLNTRHCERGAARWTHRQ